MKFSLYHKKRIVVGAIFAIAVLMFIREILPPDHPSGWNYESFANLPVQDSGRIKPVDTVARNSLMVIADKQSFQDRSGNKLSALEWFIELTLNPQAAASNRVFRIDHPDLVGLLGYQNEKRKYFSLREIAPHFDELQNQFSEIEEEPKRRNPYEKALAKLQESINLYDSVAYSFVPPPSFGTPLESYNILMRAHTDATTGNPDSDNHATAGNALRLFERQFGQLAATLKVQAVPPRQGELPMDWKNIGASLLESIDSGEVDPVLLHYARLAEAYQDRDSQSFNEQLDQLFPLVRERAGERASKTGFEYFFNTFSPFYYSMQLYGLVLLVAAFSWMWWRRELSGTALGLLAIAFLVHTFGIFARIYIQERPPVTNLYSSAIFVGWAAVPLCLYLDKRYRNGIPSAAAALLGFSTLVIAHNLSFSGDTMEMMRAVLDSNFWLATHVPVVTIGYSATFLAGFLAALYIIRDRIGSGLEKQDSRAIQAMVYGAVCFALLFSFVGTVLGGIWADQSWGRFWGWDPKENGALMIVLWNAVILHARWGKIVSPTGFMQMALIGNIITAWSWFGTNMLGVGLHSYGFMDSAFLWLLAFIASQLLLVGIGWLPHKAKES